jgi:hypothetical protein
MDTLLAALRADPRRISTTVGVSMVASLGAMAETGMGALSRYGARRPMRPGPTLSSGSPDVDVRLTRHRVGSWPYHVRARVLP